jgi:glutamine amidotransferase
MIVLLDYGAGNLRSVHYALTELGIANQISGDPQKIMQADKIIFPGVGAASAAMSALKKDGLDQALKEYFKQGKPLLAICIGLQLLFTTSAENNGISCLDIIPGEVVKFDFAPEVGAKIPQMGWNQVDLVQDHPLWQGLPPQTNFYFVHSYYVKPQNEEIIYGRTDYEGTNFTAAIAYKNLFATQFHPEKSGRWGLQILQNFCQWQGEV